LQARRLASFHFGILFFEDGPFESLLESEQVPEHPRQLMGNGGDGFLCAQARLPSPV